MGAEQSSSGGRVEKGQGGYDQPIGGDSARPLRGKLASTSSVKSESAISQGSAATNESSSASSGSRSQLPYPRRRGNSSASVLGALGSSRSHDIVVVREGGPCEEGPAPELRQLKEIPVFGPLLRSSVGGGGKNGDAAFVDRIDHKAILHFCVRYQEHLKQCAEAVSFDQNTLCARIKEMDFDIKSLHDILTERQKKYARHAEQLHKVQEMTHILTRARSTAECLAQAMDELNSLLPADQQLEPFRFLPEDSDKGKKMKPEASGATSSRS